jgi:hypothetical protein
MKTITVMIAMMVAFAVSLIAKADYWMMSNGVTA